MNEVTLTDIADDHVLGHVFAMQLRSTDKSFVLLAESKQVFPTRIISDFLTVLVFPTGIILTVLEFLTRTR